MTSPLDGPVDPQFGSVFSYPHFDPYMDVPAIAVPHFDDALPESESVVVAVPDLPDITSVSPDELYAYPTERALESATLEGL